MFSALLVGIERLYAQYSRGQDICEHLAVKSELDEPSYQLLELLFGADVYTDRYVRLQVINGIDAEKQFILTFFSH